MDAPLSLPPPFPLPFPEDVLGSRFKFYYERDRLLSSASLERAGICILAWRKEICCHLHLVRERAPQLEAAAKLLPNTPPVK